MGTGSRVSEGARTIVPKTEVSLVHGDLRFARYPVLVGHYKDDPINGAEAALDDCLNNHLSAVRDMGLYPGASETCEVILRLARPDAAIATQLYRAAQRLAQNRLPIDQLEDVR